MAMPLASQGPSGAEAQVGPHHVAALARVAREAAGIRLTTENVGFLTRRLPKLIEASGERSVAAYVVRLQREPELAKTFVEGLTVHTTSFFREERQYRWLAETGLPQLAQERNTLLIWSAAASVGAEGWTALMVMDQARQTSGRVFRARLVGTDVSRSVIEKARRAIYTRQEVEGVPEAMLKAYFLRARNGGDRVRIAPELRSLAEWRVGNLATGDGLSGIRADVAFLRNVLIYFPADIQAAVIDRTVRNLRPGGYLLSGHSETGLQHPDLVPIEPSIYQRKVGP